MGTIEATKIATGTEDELRLEIHGSRGALRFNGMDPHHLEFYDATAPDQPQGGLRGWNRIDTGQRYPPPATGFPSPKAAIGWLRSHVACLANFLEAVADGRPAEPGLEQGIRVQHLMDCVRRSAAEAAGSTCRQAIAYERNAACDIMRAAAAKTAVVTGFDWHVFLRLCVGCINTSYTYNMRLPVPPDSCAYRGTTVSTRHGNFQQRRQDA